MRALLAETSKRVGARRVAPEPSDGLQRSLEALIADEHPKALAFIRDESPLVAACCTRRAAKSRSWIRKMLRTAAGTPHGRVVYINETRAECERIAWRGNGRDGLLTLNDQYKLGGLPNHSKLQLWFPANGGLIELIGADDLRAVNKVRGTALHLLGVDEAQKAPHIDALVLEAAGMGMMDYGGQVGIFGTPGRDLAGLFYDVTRDDGQATDGWSVHRFSVVDNPFFGDTEAERYERVIVAFCEKHGLAIDDPIVQRECFGRWVKEDARYVYAVHQVPEHKLCYAEPRVREDGLPDIPKAIADLPKGPEWQYTLFADLGFLPDPFAYVLWAWSWTAPKLYEVCSWKRLRLDADEQLAELMWVGGQVDVSIVGGDVGGAMTPTGKGWAKRWNERFGRDLVEAEKSRKFEHIELFNTDIRQGRIQLRKGGELHREMQAVLWLPAPADERVVRKLREDPRIPNDVCDAALYGHRHTMQHLAKAPPQPKPKEGTPEHAAALERRLDDEEDDDGGEAVSYYG